MRNSSGTPLGLQKYAPCKIGALGYTTGGDISSDGTLQVARTDVGGAYRRESTVGTWVQVIDNSKWTLPTTSAGSGMGVEEILIAPSNANVVWMFYWGRCYRSGDRAVTFSDTNLNGTTGLYFDSNGGSRRVLARKAAIDQSNSEVVYFGSPQNGLWRHLSTGWAQIASVPVSTETDLTQATVIVVVDPNSATIGTAPDVRHSVVYCSVNGVGLYKSTDGGTTFTKLIDATALGPTSTISCTTNSTTTVTTSNTSGLIVGMNVTGAGIPAGAKIASITNGTTFVLTAAATTSATGNLNFYWYRALNLNINPVGGALWLCQDFAALENVYKSTNGGTTWTNVITGVTQATFSVTNIEFDPKDATGNRMSFILGLGEVGHSDDGGTTWIEYSYGSNSTQSTNCPLVAEAYAVAFAGNFTATISKVQFYPNKNEALGFSGFGVFKFAVPTWPTQAAGLVWIEDTAGIEELVAWDALITPTGAIITSSGDRAVIKLSSSGFATKQYPSSGLVEGARRADYAIDDHTWLAVPVCNGSQDYTAFSTNSGDTWTPFGGAASDGTSLQPILAPGGSIAVGNKNQVVRFPAANTWPRYWTGTAWQKCTFAGFTTIADGSLNGWDNSGGPLGGLRRRICCADKSNPGTFYCYNVGTGYGSGGNTSVIGIWKSTDSGANWTHISSGPTDIATTSILQAGFSWNAQLLRAPNGDMFLASGPLSSDWTEDANAFCYKSTDNGVTWAALAGITEAQYVAIGAPCPGKSTPYSLYIIGWLNHVGRSEGGGALLESLDGGSTFTVLNDSGWFDDPYCLAADPNVFRHLIIGHSGTAYQESFYSYQMLLKGS